MRPRGERKQSGHVGKANHDNADQLTNQSRRRGDSAINQSIKDCATFPSPCGQPTGATEFRQHGGKRTAVATWQLTAVPTRKLTAVLTRQLTMWPVGSATANFSHVLTACFLQQLIYFNVLTASTATADIPYY